MVLQDGLEVVFLEKASSEEDTPSDKELSNFKDFSRFLGMLVEGYEDKIALLLKKLKKMTGGGHSVKKEKRKWCSHRALKGNQRGWILRSTMESLRTEGVEGANEN